jgi:HEPN domain-containing protein
MATNGDYARVLLRKAGADEAVIQKLGSDTDIADEIIGFHAQQAVEKAIKAVLGAYGIKYKFSHSLRYLRQLCAESDIELPSSLDGMEQLTPFAAIERYGGEEPIPSVPGSQKSDPLDRDQALKWADAAVAWAREVIDGFSEDTHERASQSDPGRTPPPS